MDKHPTDGDNNDEAPSLLSLFHEDVLLCILGFVADVPFEIRENNHVRCYCPFPTAAPSSRPRDPIDPHSSLTHTLPLVSRQFHRLCSNHDLFWRSALLRLIENPKRGIWEDGLRRLVYDAECRQMRDRLVDDSRRRVRRDQRTRNNANRNHDDALNDQELSINATDGGICEPQSDTTTTQSKQEHLLAQACHAILQNPPQNHTATTSGIYQCIYRSILQHHIQYQAPIFYMPTSIRLGVEYGLHFFEPRYRILISEVMSDYPVLARRGQRIHPIIPGVYPPPAYPIRNESLKLSLLQFLEEKESLIHQYGVPTFIHAHQSPLAPNTPATIVQVTHCQISPDGRADVMLCPIAYIWLTSIWERVGTGGLVEGRGLRMEKEVGRGYEVWCGMSAFGNGDGRGRGRMLPIP